jgi:hypothetical protein
MANQSDLKVLVDKVKLRIEAYQRGRKKSPVRAQKQALRQIEDSWTETCDALPLEIGNELLITDVIVNLYRHSPNVLGRVVIIDEISTKESGVVKASAFGIQLQVNTKVAGYMRAAYLQREQAWSAPHAPESV